MFLFCIGDSKVKCMCSRRHYVSMVLGVIYLFQVVATEHKNAILVPIKVSGGSPIIPLVVHQPAAPSLQKGISTNQVVTMWFVCGCS